MSNLIVCCLFYVFSFILLILGLMTFLVFQMDRDGLAHSLCKCEKLHNHSSLIQARIVNGNKFTSRHGLSWIVSIYFQVNSQGNQSSRQLEFTEGLSIRQTQFVNSLHSLWSIIDRLLETRLDQSQFKRDQFAKTLDLISILFRFRNHLWAYLYGSPSEFSDGAYGWPLRG